MKRIFALFLAVLFVLVSTVSCAKPAEAEETAKIEYREEYSRELVALTPRYGIEGTFYLGSGRVSSESSWTWLEKGEDGSTRVVDGKGDEVVYYEDINPGEIPVVTLYQCYYNDEATMDFSYECASLEEKPDVLLDYIARFYVLHIPKGSTISMYDIDISSATQP